MNPLGIVEDGMASNFSRNIAIGVLLDVNFTKTKRGQERYVPETGIALNFFKYKMSRRGGRRHRR
jgi:hypothetical protein